MSGSEVHTKLCGCGCQEITPKGKDYIQGHNSRIESISHKEARMKKIYISRWGDRKKTQSDIDKLLNEKFPSLCRVSDYVNLKTPLSFKCSCGEIFQRTPTSLLHSRKAVGACWKCINKLNKGNLLKVKDGRKKLILNIWSQGLEVISISNKDVRIRCSCGTSFTRKAQYVRSKKHLLACDKCNKEKLNIRITSQGPDTCIVLPNYQHQTIVKWLSNKNIELLSPKLNDSENILTKALLTLKCSCGLIYKRAFHNLLKFSEPQLCPKCTRFTSKAEDDIFEYLVELGVKNIDRHNHSIIYPNEIDIYLPDYKLGIEFNGLYWHSSKILENHGRDGRTYHQEKTKKALKKNVRLIHIFEHQWKYKKDIIKSILGSFINKHLFIHGRKCSITNINWKQASKFYKENHLHGAGQPSKYNYGLIYKNELMCIASFSSKNISHKFNSSEEWELLRFANKLNTSIHGGLSKLIKYFTNEVKPKAIISYCDSSIFSGNLYEKLGFKEIDWSEPNYYYFLPQTAKPEHRFKFAKHFLVKQGFDPNKTAEEIMRERGYLKYYDCGHKKYRLELNHV